MRIKHCLKTTFSMRSILLEYLMNKKIIKDTTSPKYGEAKAKLIEATLDCLMTEGAEGCSIRKICERANVSIGLESCEACGCGLGA